MRLAFGRRDRLTVPRAGKRRMLGAAAILLALGGLAGASMLGADAGDAAQSPQAERERGLAIREAELTRREAKVADLERRGAATESQIEDSQKRIAALESRRAELQRQIAELTAPVSPANGEDGDIASSTDQSVAAERSDPSPPDEAATDTAPTAAAPASDSAVVGRSSVTVDDRSAPSDEQAPVVAEQAPASAVETVAATHNGVPMRVFIHVRSSDASARERAQAVAAELRRRGVAVAEIRGVPRAVRRDAVRFFYDADREAASLLRDAVREASPGGVPQSQDFRGFRAPPRPGTLELWLS